MTEPEHIDVELPDIDRVADKLTPKEQDQARKLAQMLSLDWTDIPESAQRELGMQGEITETYESDPFVQDMIFFMRRVVMGGVRLRDWSTEDLHEEYKKWMSESYQAGSLEPKKAEIRDQILAFIKVAVEEKKKVAIEAIFDTSGGVPQKPSQIEDEVYGDYWESQPLPEVRDTTGDWRRGRKTAREEARALREETERRMKLLKDQVSKMSSTRDKQEQEEILSRQEAHVRRMLDQGYSVPPDSMLRIAHSLATYEGGFGREVHEWSVSEVLEDTGEYTSKVKDYGDFKNDLIAELKRGGPTVLWDEYGWAKEDRREEIELVLMDRWGLDPHQARQIMAAALLHGFTGNKFYEGIVNVINSGGRLLDYLQIESAIIRNDEDIFAIFEPNPQARERHYSSTDLVDQPANFENLAWQMVHAPGANDVFKEGHAIEIFNNVVTDEGEEVITYEDGRTRKIKKLQCRQLADADRMINWFYDRATEAHGNSTTRPIDFEAEVQIEKSGLGIAIQIYKMMLARKGDMFRSGWLRDKKGEHMRFGRVADLFEALSVILSENRSSGIVVPQVMRTLEALIEHRQKETTNNNPFRDIGGTSLAEQSLRLSERWNGTRNADGKVGAVENTVYMAICSARNLDKMSRILGADVSELLSLRNIRRVRDEIVDNLRSKDQELISQGKAPERKDSDWLDFYLRPEDDISYETTEGKIHKVKLSTIFDEHGSPRLGTIEERNNFSNFINSLTHFAADARLEKVIRKIIIDQAFELHGLSKTINGSSVTGLEAVIDISANGRLYRFGMYAFLDNELSGRSEEAKWNSRFRRQLLRNYAGAGGNPYNFDYLPNILLPEAIWTTTRGGDVLQNVWEEAALVRSRISQESKAIALQLLETDDWKKKITTRAQKIKNVKSMPGKTDREIEAVAKKEILSEAISHVLIDTGRIEEYNKVARKLQFDAEKEKEFGTEHYAHAAKLAKELITKNLGLSECVSVGIDGPTISMEKWLPKVSDRSKEIVKHFKDVRFDAEISAWDFDLEPPRERTMTIAEYMVGKPILRAMGLIGDNGLINHEALKHATSKDFSRWVMAGLIAAEVKQFREYALGNLNPRYSYAVTEAILEAIERIPGDFGIDIDDSTLSKPEGMYFSKEMIAWIREEANAGRWTLFGIELASNFFLGSAGKKDGLFSGIGDMWALFGKAIFQGV